MAGASRSRWPKIAKYFISKCHLRDLSYVHVIEEIVFCSNNSPRYLLSTACEYRILKKISTYCSLGKIGNTLTSSCK